MELALEGFYFNNMANFNNCFNPCYYGIGFRSRHLRVLPKKSEVSILVIMELALEVNQAA